MSSSPQMLEQAAAKSARSCVTIAPAKRPRESHINYRQHSFDFRLGQAAAPAGQLVSGRSVELVRARALEPPVYLFIWPPSQLLQLLAPLLLLEEKKKQLK